MQMRGHARSRRKEEALKLINKQSLGFSARCIKVGEDRHAPFELAHDRAVCLECAGIGLAVASLESFLQRRGPPVIGIGVVFVCRAAPEHNDMVTFRDENGRKRLANKSAPAREKDAFHSR